MTDQCSEQEWTEQESAEFCEKLRTFGYGLSEEDRKVFRGIIGGASVGLRLGTTGDTVQREGQSFGQALARFRDELPPKQRDAFTSMVTAGAVGWSVAAELAGENDMEPVAMWHALLTPLAVITVGAVLIADELIEDDEEIIVPEIQFPPSSPA